MNRLAWFSPLPPAGSGIAAYSAELLPLLRESFSIDCFEAASAPAPAGPGVDRTSSVAAGSDRRSSAHDFVWRHLREPYDLIVYQLGNAAWHDYMWAYLANYPGLVVLHDARLHHARARHLLKQERFDDYRREFWYDHPHAPREFAEYAVEGLGGPIYYLWRMVAAAVRTARGVAVHNRRVAADLRAEFPDARIDVIRMGVPAMSVDPAEGLRVRATLGIPPDALVFAAFGKVTAEKRIASALRAVASLAADNPALHLLLIGDTGSYPSLRADIAATGAGDRVSVAGEVADADLSGYLAASDVCLCLRWPTAEETSASWLRCLAAGRPTIISDLPHLVDVPSTLARDWSRSDGSRAPVAVAVDLLDEDATLLDAMRRLAADPALRREIGAAGHSYWAAEHRLELMADDYRALVRDVAVRPAPAIPDLPFHLVDDYSSHAREIASRFDVDLDILHRP